MKFRKVIAIMMLALLTGTFCACSKKSEEEIALQKAEQEIKKLYGTTAEELIVSAAALEKKKDSAIADSLAKYQTADADEQALMIANALVVMGKLKNADSVKKALQNGKAKMKDVKAETAKLAKEYEKRAKEIKKVFEKVTSPKSPEDAVFGMVELLNLGVDKNNIPLPSVDMVVELAKKTQPVADAEKLFRYELTKDGSGVKILGAAKDAKYGPVLAFPSTIEGLPVKEIKGSWGGGDGDPHVAIIVPEGVEKVSTLTGGYLVYVSLPSTLKECAKFYSCNNLARVDIPASAPLTALAGDNTGGFLYNAAITQFAIPSAVKTIGECAFEYSKLTSIEIPEGVEVIDKSAFNGCKELTTVTLPSTLKEIEGGAFRGCPNLTEVIVPEGMGKIKIESRYSSAFEGTHLNLKSQAALKAIGYTGEF